MQSEDLMDPRVSQVMEVLDERLGTLMGDVWREITAVRIVEALDQQAERLQGAER